MDKVKIGVITRSDRSSQGIYEDISHMAIMDMIKEYLLNEYERVKRRYASKFSVSIKKGYTFVATL